MKKSAFFYTLLTHLSFSMELIEDIRPHVSTITTNTDGIVSLAASITTIPDQPKHTVEAITAAVNAAMYGGSNADAIFEVTFPIYAYHIASLINAGSVFSTIYRNCANLRHHLATQCQTPKAELFNTERTIESVPWSGGATTGVLRYPSMRDNLIESLKKITLTESFLPLNEQLEYRYLSMTFKEWFPFLIENNSDQNQLLTFFLRMVSGKRENGEEDSGMLFFKFEDITGENGLNNEKRYHFMQYFQNQLYNFIEFHPTPGQLTAEQEYFTVKNLFIHKYNELIQTRHSKSTDEEFSSSTDDLYKLSLVQIKFRDSEIYTRSFMFVEQSRDPFNYANKPLCLIHPPTQSVEYHLGLCHHLFEKARNFVGSKAERLQHILRFSYYWSLGMPFARGSASINEYLTTALMICKDLGYPKRSVLKELDLYAQSLFTIEEYIEKYSALLLDPENIIEYPYPSVEAFVQEKIEQIRAEAEKEKAKLNTEQQDIIREVIKPLSNTIPNITYADGLFIPSTTAAINEIDVLVSLLKSGHNYKDILGTIAQNLYLIVSKINETSARLYITPRVDLEAEKKCKTAFEKAMIYDTNDAITLANIKEYQKIYNEKPLYMAGHEIVNDLLFFNALCSHHNIVPRLIDGSTLQRPLFKSHHVVASSETRMHELEAFISNMNPEGNASELCDIMQRYNSDKSTVHSYTQLYDFLFNSIRSTAENVLEMGIGSVDPSIAYTMGANGTVGASLRGWRAYFTQAKIFGADIAEKELFEEDRIKTFFADQLNIATIQSMFEKTGVDQYDVIIDDGLHCFQANHTFLRVAIDRLKEGGIYVIEDIAPRGINAFVELLEKMELDAAFVQLPKKPGRFDNNMFIIFK